MLVISFSCVERQWVIGNFPSMENHGEPSSKLIAHWLTISPGTFLRFKLQSCTITVFFSQVTATSWRRNKHRLMVIVICYCHYLLLFNWLLWLLLFINHYSIGYCYLLLSLNNNDNNPNNHNNHICYVMIDGFCMCSTPRSCKATFVAAVRIGRRSTRLCWSQPTVISVVTCEVVGTKKWLVHQVVHLCSYYGCWCHH